MTNKRILLYLALVWLIVPLSAMAQNGGPFPGPTQVPNVVNPKESEFQRETHFLTFIGSFVPESANSARAYYKAIDPNNTKATFQQWLVNAGFIGQASDWRPTGPQQIITNQTGCAATKSCTYGPNVVNADSHVIVLNAADLGFVRNQFIRCIPSCTAKNPIIYTYLENYPVGPFASTTNGSGGTTGFPNFSGYPSNPEADAAIHSAIQRPLGRFNQPGLCTGPNFNGGDCIERIADVAFEWAPPATNSTSSTRFGQLYAYIFQHNGTDSSGNPITVETTDFPASFNGDPICDFGAKNCPLQGSSTQVGLPIFVNPGGPGSTPPSDKFAPNLDGIGFKQHPGVCFICHGGQPAKLTTSGAYPHGGNVNGFRFLPLDVKNLMFAAKPYTDVGVGNGDYTLAGQQAQIKAYNVAVLATVPTYAEDDGTGAVRVAHLREVINGWYSTNGNYSNDTLMQSSTQNSDFIPKGWREPPNGTAALHAEDLYKQVVGPSCRSCHFNRELSLDFGTYANFHQESDLTQLALIAKCKQFNPDPPDPGAKFMPLAHLTFLRFWETQDNNTKQLFDSTPLENEVDRLAEDFGFTQGVQGYCNTNP
jgi:hypothetical protein